MKNTKFLYGIVLTILGLNTVMACLTTFWSIDNRTTLNNVQVEIQELKRRVEMEIKLRQEILPEIKKSTALLSLYNPSLDPMTALSYAIKIWQCSDDVTPPDLLTAIIVVESSARYDAISPKGAMGLMQIMPFYATNGLQELEDPYRNIELGAEILKNYIKRYGLIGGLRSYNSGPYNQKTEASLQYAKKVLATAVKHF